MITEILNYEALIGIGAVCALIPLCFVKRIGWLGAFLWAWCLLSSVKILFYPHVSPDEFPWPNKHSIEFIYSIKESSGKALVFALALPTFILLLPERVFQYWKKAAFLLFLGQFLSLLILNRALLNASSMDVAFQAVMLPTLSPLCFPFVVLLALLKRGMSVFMVLGVQYLALTSYLPRWKAKLWAWACLLPLAGIAYLLPTARSLGAGERLGYWQNALYYWNDLGFVGTGSGVGTFVWIGQNLTNDSTALFDTFHNDWFQFAFEAGVVGAALACLFYGRLLIRARKKALLFTALLGVGALATTYYPMHLVPTQLFVLCLVREVLELKETS